MKILVFNPEHDLCLAANQAGYMPPQSAVQFAEDCYGLMQYLGEEDDVCMPASREGEAYREHPDAEAIVPWGWNHTLLRQMRSQGVPSSLMLDEGQVNWYLYGSERRHTSYWGEGIRRLIEPFCNESPTVLHSLTECEEYLRQRSAVVFKNPLSGSGRGIRPVSGEFSEKDVCWLKKVLSQHLYVMGEPRCRVVQDFAVLFEVGAKVRLAGYSLFETQGFVYQSNILLADDLIRDTIAQYIPIKVLDHAINNLAFFLEKKLSPVLRSRVGVDMFIFEREDGSYGLNPLVEINCRYTMGFVAHELLLKHSEHHGKRFRINTPSNDNPHYSYTIE